MSTNTMEQPKIKKLYALVVEGTAPVRLEVQTWAYDEHEALENLEKPSLVTIRQRPDVVLPQLKKKKVTVKDAFTSLIQFVRNY